jgi:hypothetical protein
MCDACLEFSARRRKLSSNMLKIMRPEELNYENGQLSSGMMLCNECYVHCFGPYGENCNQSIRKQAADTYNLSQATKLRINQEIRARNNKRKR